MANFYTEQEQLLRKRMIAILKRYRKLDNLDYIMTKTPIEINKILKKYEKDLQFAMLSFFTSKKTKEYLDLNIKDFMSKLKTFLEDAPKKGSHFRTKKAERLLLQKAAKKSMLEVNLKRTVDAGYKSKMDGVIKHIMQLQKTKYAEFAVLKELAILPSAVVREHAIKRLISVSFTTKGITKTYDKKQLSDLYDRIVNRHGRYDTIQYRDGRNVPIRTYLDMRMTSTAKDIQRLTAQVGAAQNNIYTLKISSHNATDSCKFHEGEIVLASETARKLMLNKYKDNKVIKAEINKMKTLQEVENDQTHMFSYGCKHDANIYPIQFESESNMQKELEKNPMAKIPKKINETQIIEQSIKEVKAA